MARQRRSTGTRRARSTSMIEIVKPPSDSRGYRVVILPNGMTAMLISEALDADKDECDDTIDLEQDMDTDDFMEGEASAALCVGTGSFSDLPEIPGFAHFMEHMVFMGSQKFPKENYWDAFLAKSDGESNAWTDCERSCFYFVCSQGTFLKAMDVFAHFFISPLFNKASVDKEIMAVDNECQMVSSNDNERMRSIIAHELVEKGHPMAKFMAGNKKSLKDDPEQNKVNVYKQLHSFYERMYSAHYMTLVVHSVETLDVMENNVLKIFSKIPNNGIPRPKFIKPPFQEKNMNKLLKVTPVGDIHRMEIIWALPPLMEHYRARVIEYLSLLLGHEGRGSILSILKHRLLAKEIAGGNDMTGFTHNSTWTAFMLSLKLTEKGLQNYEEVLEVIFQYVLLLKQKLPEHVFEEQKHIQETKYIFAEQESIYTYVEELAESMHMFPPEHYLCGKTLFFEYNEQLVRDCLDFLRPQGMLVLLFDKNFGQLYGLSEEPWLNSKYTVEDFSPSLIQKLSNVSINPELRLPDPNPYIATDFKLIKSRKSTKFPVVVMNEKGGRIWYKKDNEFHLPNAYVFLNFMSTAISKNSQNVLLGDIFLTLLLAKLTETLYNATLAGYEYSVEGMPEGVVLTLGGYSEKLKLVTRDTIKAFTDLEIDEASFNCEVAHLKQVYLNELIKPLELARAVRFSVLELKDPSLLERYEQLGVVTYSMLQDYIKEFRSSLFVEALVTGNLKPQDAVDIGQMALKVVKKAINEDEFPNPNLMELPPGDFKIFLPAINKEDTNSCVQQYFQLGLGTIKNQCINDLLGIAMNEPLFNVLRTEYQLGYSVWCQPHSSHGVLGFFIVVESQANKFSMKQVDEIITKFLCDFEKTLEEIPAQKFKDLIDNQASLRELSDGDLYAQSNRFWFEILKHSYIFNRSDLEYKAMQNLTQQDVMDWYQNFTTDKMRKLTIMVEGCTKSKCDFSLPDEATPTPFKGITSLLKDLSTCNLPSAVGGRGKGKSEDKCKGKCRPATPTKASLLDFQSHGDNYITNLCAFKSQLSTLPYHIIKE